MQCVVDKLSNNKQQQTEEIGQNKYIPRHHNAVNEMTAQKWQFIFNE